MSERAGSDQRRERAELDPRFGRIGISAVAAAVRFKSESKNSVHAPAPRGEHEPVDEDAAA